MEVDGGRDARAITPSDSGSRDAFIAMNDASTTDEDAGRSGETMPIIVGAGSNHARFLSIDEGRTWCLVDRATDAEATGFDNPFLFRNISYTNGRFVAGSARALMVSFNGYEWSDHTPEPLGNWIAQVQFGNDWWVLTGGYGLAMRSRDLTSWENTSDTLDGTQASRSLAFGNGMFMTGRDGVGWWSSTDGTGWTQMNASAMNMVIFDGTDFVENPGYDRGRGIRLRGIWPDGIERADDSDSARYTRVATTVETFTHAAFGFAPVEDFAAGRVPEPLASCLGL
jgi:hypothetical protein